MSMQFRLHINDTNDGSKIAEDLRRMADMVEGHILTNGFRRSTLRPGYAIMEIREPCTSGTTERQDLPDNGDEI